MKSQGLLFIDGDKGQSGLLFIFCIGPPTGEFKQKVNLMGSDRNSNSKNNKPKLTAKEKKAAKQAKKLEKAGGIPLPKSPN